MDECLLKIVSKISDLHSRSSFRLKMLQIYNNNCEIKKYQHKKSYIKPHANGCSIVSQKTHNTECELRKYKFLNEDIDVRDRSLFMWGGGGGESWGGPSLFFLEKRGGPKENFTMIGSVLQTNLHFLNLKLERPYFFQ